MLSPKEVDALLSAVNKDDAKKGEGKGLLQSSIISGAKKVTVYNFRRPDRVSKDQLRSLELMHETFARNLSVALSGYLRILAEVNLVSVDQMTYNEFLLSLPNPTCFNILDVSPLEGNIVVEINPTIAFPVIDRLLGGSGQGLKDIRELTDMELHILDGFIARVVDNLQETWRDIVNLTFTVKAKETNPQVAQIVSLSEIVILMVFEIKIAEASGFLNICIPFLSIEDISDKLSLQYRFATTKKHQEEAGKVKKLLNEVNVPVEAYLGKVNITMKDLLELRKGDVINLEKSIDNTLEVKISDQLKFVAKPGVVNRKKAVQIVRKIKDE